MEIHKQIYKLFDGDQAMLNISMRLLRCDDITWDSSQCCLMMAGEVLATCYVNDAATVEVKIAKKFQRDNSIVTADKYGYRIRLDKHQQIISWHANGYCQFKLINGSIDQSKKRHALEAFTICNANITKMHRKQIFSTC